MRRLFLYIRRYRLRYAFAILCTVATATLAMVIPFLIRNAINAIARGQSAGLARLAGLICVTAVVMALVRWFSRFVLFNIGRYIEYDLRNDLFAHLLTLGPRFYERLKTGDLMSRLINDLGAVRMLVGMGVLTFTNAPLYCVYALGIMASLNPRLTLASLIPYAMLLAEMMWLMRALMERSFKVQEGLGNIGAKVQESLAGIHVVKAYNLEDYETSQFRWLNDEYNRQGIELSRLRSILLPLIRGTVASSSMIVLIYGGAIVRRHGMTIGDLVAFLSYLALLAWPTTSLGWMVSIYQRGKASMKRLNEIFQYPSSFLTDHVDGRLEIAGPIEWQGVWFSYLPHNGPDGDASYPWALRDINVRVAPGTKLAIVGRTGSGKSTMVKLLVRLMEPGAGRILLDGKDIRQLPLSALRRTVGMVPQEPTLFSDTLARNIAFGRVAAELREIENAANVAGLEADLAALPQGLQTIVGERGMSLSGGQKQRVTIARLLTYDPAVVVLDDALSSVDTETEKAVLKRLGESVRGRTMIVVSHRASTVRDADEIIVLDNGVIAERGTHEQLMALGRIYADLFRRQVLEEELARY
jgi:ATP-binding cassette, subfamily B, multidrug efflux pump